MNTGCPDANGAWGFDGRSFLDVLAGETDHVRDAVFAQQTTVGVHGYKDPYPIRAVRDQRYKYVRNLAPENTYQIGGIHRSNTLQSWQKDAASDPQLAARIEWLFHRPAEELYDLSTDELEEHNLADDPQLAKVKAALAAQLDAWMAQQGDRGLETELLAPTRQGPIGPAGNDRPVAAAKQP